MSKKAIIVLAEGFEEIEAVTVIDILRRAGIETTVAGLDDLSVQGSHGITVSADVKLDTAGSDFDICIFPGGMPGATHLGCSEKVQALIETMNKDKKIIAAICAAPAMVLAPIGILKNKKATCFPGMQKHFEESTTYVTDNVVTDGNVITSRGTGTALAFSLAIVEKIIGEETADKVRKATLAN
ncbi:MAG: DJ-1/PfpI family protein [Candidatus Omnitrophica bacterium]|nr:DJ-1/PfpI family protein [Candidatus Omnitrophota bacterium]